MRSLLERGCAQSNGTGRRCAPLSLATSLKISDEREHDGMWDALTRLAVEAGGVIALRMTRLMLGGKRAARREVRLMVSEKIDTAAKAARSMAGGATAEEIVGQYRKRVAANARRLSKIGISRPVKKRRRRK
jgi:hypothetical protein